MKTLFVLLTAFAMAVLILVVIVSGEDSQNLDSDIRRCLRIETDATALRCIASVMGDRP